MSAVPNSWLYTAVCIWNVVGTEHKEPFTWLLQSPANFFPFFSFSTFWLFSIELKGIETRQTFWIEKICCVCVCVGHKKKKRKEENFLTSSFLNISDRCSVGRAVGSCVHRQSHGTDQTTLPLAPAGRSTTQQSGPNSPKKKNVWRKEEKMKLFLFFLISQFL